MAKELEIISLQDIIPSSIAHDRNVQAIIQASDPEFQKVSQDTREAFIISRINELPENVVDLLAWQWHVDSYEPDLPIETKRELVLDSITWHRKKGTKASIESALKKLGFVPTIKEWFEIGTKPHTFEVYGHYKDNDLNVDFLGPNTDEILPRVIEITKPARSQLLSLIVAPIPIDFKEHTCFWDKCIWGHPEIELHDWGLLPLPIFENDPISGIDFIRGFNVISDTQFWDMSIWGGTPHRDLFFGQNFKRGIFVNLDRESTATWYIPYEWAKFTWEDSERYSRDFELLFQRGIGINADIKPQPFGTTYIIGMIASLQPYWDFYTWIQHGDWGEDFGVPYVAPAFRRGNKASMQWSKEEAPFAKWSKYRTWGDATWDKAPTNAGTWEAGTWIDLEEETA